NRSEAARTASRSRRLILLRSGALPVFLVTVYPTAGTGSATPAACNTKPRLAIFLPRAAFRNCARFFRRRIGDAGVPGTSARSADLGREPLAPERATAIDDLAAVLGRHAGTETVTAGAHKIARLKSTLH